MAKIREESSEKQDYHPKSIEEIIALYPVNEFFSTLVFGKPLLRQSANIIQQSLLIEQRYQPFDLAPQIQELLQLLQKIPHYFSKLHQFFYQLPIIGFYFSPLRNIDNIRHEILQQITRFNNLLKAQIIQVQQKNKALSALAKQNNHALIEHGHYQIVGSEILKVLESSDELKHKSPHLQQQLSTLKLSSLSLTQHAEQLNQALKRTNHYLAKMTFIHESLFPLWQNQLKLIHDIVVKKASINLIQTPLHPQKRSPINPKIQEKALSNLQTKMENEYQQNQFDLGNIQNIQQETINALKALLSPFE